LSFHCGTWLVVSGVITEEALAEKLATIRPHLDERQWRLLLGVEAEAIGWGGIGLVARLTGASRTTVQTGVNEIRSGVVPDGRVRAPGAGRPSVEEVQPGIEQALEALVGPESRGDPQSPLRWTTKSAAKLVKGLFTAGFVAGPTTVRRLLRQAGYRLQATFKTKEGAQHPDRDAQFRYINDLAAQFLADGDPVASVDAKKKELVGEYANKGREWQPAGQPVAVNGHDFPTGIPKAIPYGVYDIGADEGFVSVGIDHETAPFAVNAIRTWWQRVGRLRYPDAKRLLLTADGGGSNGYRRRGWKVELSKLAAEIGLDITVCHFPPGTSKWNKVEHRLFSFISINWRGRPLTDYQVIIETIAATTTKTGLTVEAVLDNGTYPSGVKVSDKQIKAVPLTRHQFHGEWNYTIHCGPIPEAG
jgi:Rhodopirellula transposase DDE domain